MKILPEEPFQRGAVGALSLCAAGTFCFSFTQNPLQPVELLEVVPFLLVLRAYRMHIHRQFGRTSDQIRFTGKLGYGMVAGVLASAAVGFVAHADLKGLAEKTEGS